MSEIKIENRQLMAVELRRAARDLFPGFNLIIIGRKEYRSPALAMLFEESHLDAPVVGAGTNWELLQKFNFQTGPIRSKLTLLREKATHALIPVDPPSLRFNRAKSLCGACLFPRARYILRKAGAEHIYTVTETNGARILNLGDDWFHKKDHPTLKTEIATLFDALDEVEEWMGEAFEIKTSAGEIGVISLSGINAFWDSKGKTLCRHHCPSQKPAMRS